LVGDPQVETVTDEDAPVVMSGGETATEHCGATMVSFHVESAVTERTTICACAAKAKPATSIAKNLSVLFMKTPLLTLDNDLMIAASRYVYWQ